MISLNKLCFPEIKNSITTHKRKKANLDTFYFYLNSPHFNSLSAYIGKSFTLHKFKLKSFYININL